METRVVHCKKEAYDVYIGRPSKWGNPFSHKKGTQATTVVESVEVAIALYHNWLWDEITAGRITVGELSGLYGKTLGCWCKPGPCHGDVLARAAAWAARQD